MAIRLPDLGVIRKISVLAVIVLAGMAAVLALVNMLAARGNTKLIGEVRERQQVINQGNQLSPLNLQLSQLIGRLALQSGDIDLRAALERHGVMLNEGALDGGAAAAQKP